MLPIEYILSGSLYGVIYTLIQQYSRYNPNKVVKSIVH